MAMGAILNQGSAAIDLATSTQNGLMSAGDKEKLDDYAPTQILISADTSKPSVVNGAILITYE